MRREKLFEDLYFLPVAQTGAEGRIDLGPGDG
jgi:hypothetical protein